MMNNYLLDFSNFVILTFLHSANCTRILLSAHLFYKKYLRAFDVISIDFARYGNIECECSHQDAKNGILNGLLLH